jgi:hypothetical protein
MYIEESEDFLKLDAPPAAQQLVQGSRSASEFGDVLQYNAKTIS